MRRGLRIALRGRRDPLPVAGRRSRTSGGIGDLHTRKVLDLTIRLAEVMLSSGSGTADVVATAQDVAQAYQLTDCVVDITVTTIIVSALATTDTPPVTIMRSVRTRSTDYSRLAELDRLVQRITSGGVAVDQAHEAMDELTERPHPYPRWLATAGAAGFALGVAMLLGGTWLTCVLAAVTSGVIDRLGRLLNRIGTPLFFQRVFGAGIATLVAVAAYLIAGQDPTALVATGIVVLLSGMTLVGSMQDAVTGYMLTALARLGDALFLTAGIVVGILISLRGVTNAGIQIELHVDATTTLATPGMPLPILVAVSGAASRRGKRCGAVRRVPDDRELCAATFCGHRRTLGRTRRTGAHRTRRGRVRPSGRHLDRRDRRRLLGHPDLNPSAGSRLGDGHRRHHADAAGPCGLPCRVRVRRQ